MGTSVNNKCRAFTSLEQSKKLAEILSLESADMHYSKDFDGRWVVDLAKYASVKIPKYAGNVEEHLLPCWSLAVLVNVLPSRLFDSTPKRKELYLLPDLDKSYCFYRQFAVKTKGKIYLLTEGECLVDACVAMIEQLHELKML